MRVFIDTFQAIKALIDAVSAKIGTSSELWGGSTKTVLAYTNAAYKHIHNSSYILPDDCSLFRASTHNDANTFGAFVELVALTTKAIDFHWCSLVDIEDTANHILEIHIIDAGGASVQYLGAISFTRTGAQVRSFQLTAQCPVIPSGVRVGARVKNNKVGVDYVDFTLTYHDYT